MAFVTFSSRWGAVLAAQSQQHTNPLLWITEMAPEPRDVIWQNLAIQYRHLPLYRIVILVAASLLTIFFVLPVTAVQGIAKYERLKKWFPPAMAVDLMYILLLLIISAFWFLEHKMFHVVISHTLQAQLVFEVLTCREKNVVGKRIWGSALLNFLCEFGIRSQNHLIGNYIKSTFITSVIKNISNVVVWFPEQLWNNIFLKKIDDKTLYIWDGGSSLCHIKVLPCIDSDQKTQWSSGKNCLCSLVAHSLLFILFFFLSKSDRSFFLSAFWFLFSLFVGRESWGGVRVSNWILLGTVVF